MNYDFLVPSRTIFGWGRFEEAGVLARSLGTRAFVVSGSRHLENAGILDELSRVLGAAGVEAIHLGSIHREPRVEDVDRLAARIRERRVERASSPSGADLIIGIGGGSALDLAKATSALATNPEITTVRDCLEGVGRGLTIRQDPLPMLAVPTTAGTGSECTKNAVISSDAGEGEPFKKSLRSDHMVPRVVLLDPQLTTTLPAAVTAQTGMDAMTQLMESAISGRARPIPKALALHGLQVGLPFLARAVEDPADRQAREALAHAAYLSGMALANSGLGMAHGVAAALGVLAEVPHGLACAIMLPAALEANREVRRSEIASFARMLGHGPSGDDREAAAAAADLVRELNRRIGIPLRLGDLGVRTEQIPDLVRGSRGNSMSGNPRPLDDGELTAILEGLL